MKGSVIVLVAKEFFVTLMTNDLTFVTLVMMKIRSFVARMIRRLFAELFRLFNPPRAMVIGVLAPFRPWKLSVGTHRYRYISKERDAVQLSYQRERPARQGDTYHPRSSVVSTVAQVS